MSKGYVGISSIKEYEIIFYNKYENCKNLNVENATLLGLIFNLFNCKIIIFFFYFKEIGIDNILFIEIQLNKQ